MVERYDILGQLPIEISQKILMYSITPEHLLNVSKCCKRWKEIISGSYFWRKRSEQDYNFAGSEYVESECYRKYVQNFATPWQGHYMYNRELESNWKNGVCRKMSMDCMSDIQSLVYMDDDLLIVAQTYSICIINISNGLIEKKFEVQQLYRAVVEKSEGLLIALCHDDFENNISSLIIKVWDLKTMEPMRNFEHKLILRFSKFCVYKHLIAFIRDEDNELCIFNMKTGNFVYQRREIRNMCFGSDAIAIRTGINVIEIMDLNFNTLTTLTCCGDKFIQKIQIKNNYLFVDCVRMDTLRPFLRVIRTICVWDLTTNTKLRTVEDGHFLDLTFINENKIICLKRHLAENWLVSLSLPHFDTQKIGHKCFQWNMYTSNNRFLFTDITATSLKLRCPRTQELIRCVDLKEFNTGRYFYCRFGQIDILMVSNKNLAYVQKVNGKDIVHIMDFGPDIKRL